MTLRDPSQIPRREPPEYRVDQRRLGEGWVWLEVIAQPGRVVTTCICPEDAVAAEVAIALDRDQAAQKAIEG